MDTESLIYSLFTCIYLFSPVFWQGCFLIPLWHLIQPKIGSDIWQMLKEFSSFALWFKRAQQWTRDAAWRRPVDWSCQILPQSGLLQSISHGTSSRCAAAPSHWILGILRMDRSQRDWLAHRLMVYIRMPS